MKGIIVSPAKFIPPETLNKSLEILRLYVSDVNCSSHSEDQFNYFSATKIKRSEDLKKSFQQDYSFIWMSRGGYGSVHLLNRIDFRILHQEFKWIIGYSDITYFHAYLNQKMNLPSIHGTMPLDFEKNNSESIQSVVNVLEEKPNYYEIAVNSYNEIGEVEALIVGGNLSVLAAISGSELQLDTKNKILMIEEVGEALYKIDRMFYTLKMSGQLDYISGLIVGGMTDLKDSTPGFGQNVENIIKSHIEHSIPICFDFPAGHVDDNRAVVFNHEASLEVGENNVKFYQNDFNYG